jgi:hypothetical protein
MSRRKKGRRKGRVSQRPDAIVPHRGNRLEATLESVEFVRGHDGLLRGKPEPVVMVATYGVGGAGTCLVARALRRLAVHEPYPSVTTITRVPERELFRADIPHDFERVVVLALAIEEDSGRDVESIYANLASAELLSAWSEGERLPEPLTLEELARAPLTSPPKAQGVHLIFDGCDLRERCSADDWIGASLAVLEHKGGGTNLWRYHFVSSDKRNDWTALVRIKF